MSSSFFWVISGNFLFFFCLERGKVAERSLGHLPAKYRPHCQKRMLTQLVNSRVGSSEMEVGAWGD